MCADIVGLWRNLLVIDLSDHVTIGCALASIFVECAHLIMDECLDRDENVSA